MKKQRVIIMISGISEGIKSSVAEFLHAQLKGAQMAEGRNFQVFEPSGEFLEIAEAIKLN